MIQRLPLGKILTEGGIVEEEQLEEALKGQSRKVVDQPLPQRLRRALILSKMRLAEEPETTPLLGKMLIDMGLITEEQLDMALKEQRKSIDFYKSLTKEQMGSALEIALILNSTLNIAEVLPIIMKYVNQVTNSEASTLMLLDDVTGELVFCIPTGPKANKLSNIRIPPGKGIAGWVVEHKESALIPDASEDPRFHEPIDKISGFKTRSILCVPLKAKTKILGVLEVINKRNGTQFTEEDRLLLSIFAHQAAMAIENALFCSEMRDRFKEQIRIQQNRISLEKFRVLGLMSSGIAKDFNEILTSIQGYTDLIILNMEPGSPNMDKLRKIVDFVQNGAVLTRRLSEFSRSYKKNPEILEINSLIKDTLSPHISTKKKTEISTAFQKDVWNVKADPAQIKNVLTVLFMNSFIAMPDGGDLHIETNNVSINANLANKYGIKTGKYIRISIKDTGIGIAEPHLYRIFDPFFTTREMGGGTGLGLTYASSVVSNHGGTIKVQSTQNKGTTFILYLPSFEKKEIEVSADDERLNKGTETILFVDDEESLLNLGGELLKSLGYSVFLARSGREAIELYNKNMHKIDMVVLDIAMADMDGRRTFENLKNINPDVKVLLSSGYDKNDSKTIRLLSTGCRGLLEKPFNRNELSIKIRKVLDE
jgi:signal transduction histidine kinase/ActR/RegA family two-component response regulator